MTYLIQTVTGSSFCHFSFPPVNMVCDQYLKFSIVEEKPESKLLLNW